MTYKDTVYAVMTIRHAERFWTHVQICSHGASCPDCCWEWRGSRTHGYGSVRTQTHGKIYLWRANRLMWVFVYGEIPESLLVLHHCDNPPCVNPAHLWLGTPDDNQKDSMKKGRRPMGDRNGARLYPERIKRGEQSGQAKLTAQQVQAIRALRGDASQQAIADQFGISRKTVRDIHSRKNWRHLPEEGVEE